MKKLEIIQIPCLQDNYAFLVHDHEANLTATIDTPDVETINAVLSDKGWELTHIFNTHHHWDHAGGNLELKEKHGCTVIGASADAARIPGIDLQFSEGDEFLFGQHRATIHETHGHTLGHIVFHFVDDEIAFVGDTLFSLGCGRLFEGTAEQMWTSLQKIMQWPDQTALYCAHEYTLGNAKFALSIEPENRALQERSEIITKLREKGSPTIPSTVKQEKQTNPFLRPMSEEIQINLGMQGQDEGLVFEKIRSLKDVF